MDALVFAVGPLRGRDGRRRTRAADLGELLTTELRVPVRVVEVDRYRELSLRLGEDVHVAWMPPAVTVRAVDRGGVLLASTLRAQGASYLGALFVRDETKARTGEDLAGARIAWVDPDSCAGYLFPYHALVLRGHDPSRLFSAQSMLGSHAAVARAVADGTVDVGATFLNAGAGAMFSGWDDVTDEPMRPLLTTDPIPADALVAAAGLEPELRARLEAALLALAATPRGVAVLRDLFQATGLERPGARAFAPVRAAMAAVK